MPAIAFATSRIVALGGIVTTFTDMISLTGIIGDGSDIGMTSIRQKIGLSLLMCVTQSASPPHSFEVRY